MNTLISGNSYFFTEYDGINSKGEKQYEIFRAKYFNPFPFNKNGGIWLSNIHYAGRKEMETYTMTTYMSKIDKIESLCDFANFLPENIIALIDRYL
jgi:hypothetical protein